MPLGAVALASLRDSNKAPHRLYLRHPTSHAPLVELDPLDPSCFAAPSFTTGIAPAPLTKSGKPFKSRAAARRAAQPAPRPVVPTGAGGLVDALAQYAALGAAHEGVRVKASLAIALVAPGRVELHLRLEAALDPAVFLPKPYSRPRRILLDFVLPATAPGAEDTEAPREAGTDYFYACLERAPRTVRGVPVGGGGGGGGGEPGAASSAAEREAQRRRAAKGKGRARDDGQDGERERADDGPEDEQLYPAGLTVPLMPFQARSVRWMLCREGRRVVPRAREADAAVGVEEERDEGEGEGEGGDTRMRLLGGGGDEEEEEEGLDGDAPSGSGSGAGRSPLGRVDDDEDDEEEERAPPVLADLEPAELAALRRGPLWERVALEFLPSRRAVADEDQDEGEDEAPAPLELWLNRTSLVLCERDPLEGLPGGAGASASAAAVKKEGDEQDEVDADGEDARAGARVLGGQEGHGLLAEEVGLGKTVEVLSLVLIRAPLFLSSLAVSGEAQRC